MACFDAVVDAFFLQQLFTYRFISYKNKKNYVIDMSVWSVVHKVVSAIHETLDEGWDKVKEHLSVYGGM